MEPMIHADGDFGRYSCKASTFDTVVRTASDASLLGFVAMVEERAGHAIPEDMPMCVMFVMVGEWRDAEDAIRNN